MDSGGISAFVLPDSASFAMDLARREDAYSEIDPSGERRRLRRRFDPPTAQALARLLARHGR